MVKLRTNLGLLAWIPDVLVAVLEVYMELAGLGVIRSLEIKGTLQDIGFQKSPSLRNFFQKKPFAFTSW